MPSPPVPTLDPDADGPAADPAPAIDWYESEPKLSRMLVDELRRLKFRAKARLIPILLIAGTVTGVLMYRFAIRPPHNFSTIVLALQEGKVSQRDAPMPMRDLRTYVTTVLMPESELIALIEKHDLFPLRAKLGNEFAIDELWGIMEVEIFRNYFLYDHDEMGEARSARIGITVDYSDPDESLALARDLGSIVIRSAGHERDRLAKIMGDDAIRATEGVRRRVGELEAELANLEAARGEAVSAGQAGKASALRVEIAAVEGSVKRGRETMSALAKESSADQLTAAVYSAGLSLDVQMVEERKPEPIVQARYRFAVICVIAFLVILVIVAIFLGAFDSRVHDLDDVTRLGIPVVGQVPGFPGDGVGSLRQRGINRRGVTLSWR